MAGLDQCTFPLTNLTDVLTWTPQVGEIAIPSFRQTLTFSTDDKESLKRPKVLLCHDMKGGYLADRFDNGCFSAAEEGFGFSFWNWLNVDIFVYFSHALVSIPPLSWSAIAKANGVKVLGTFITEFDSGEKIWTDQLNTPIIVDQLVQKLGELSLHYGFDGWLVNIENKMCNQVHLLQRLICKLSAKIHTLIPGGLVIWYDSVTYPDGLLKWQNELNSKNEAFFDSCDGIFLNYTWTPKNLCHSLELARAKNRQFDVFVGVDVFGRNCFGGGGFNTRFAVEKISKAELSLAIFAFGWVYETLPVCNYLANQQKFWNLLQDFLPVNKRYLVPFSTEFSTSYGEETFWLGEKHHHKGPWYNLALQSPCQILANDSTAINCSISNSENAFIGSCCLDVIIDDSGYFNLFPIHFLAESNYYLCVGYKCIRLFDEANVSIEVTDNQNRSLSSLVLQTRNNCEWCLDSQLFQASSLDCVVRIASTGCNSRILIGYIGIFAASDESSKISLSYEEMVDQIKCHVKLHNVLIK